MSSPIARMVGRIGTTWAGSVTLAARRTAFSPLAAPAMVTLSALVSAAKAQPVVNPANCHAYEAVSGQMTWEQARTAAAVRTFMGVPGYLATVTSGEETAFMVSAFGARDSFALGGVQVGGPEPAGGWTWITGEPWVYTDWDTGEPNNFLIHGQREDRLAWKTSTVGRWNDVAGDIYEGPGPGQYRMNGYFVEYDLSGPVIQQGPTSATACRTGTATFSLTAGGTGPFTYQWQIQTAPNSWSTLGNDPLPLPCGGFAHATSPNAAATSIGITPCPGVDHYQIRCIVSNACGSVTSNEATYTICIADFNCDGSLNSQDFFDFLSAFFAGTPNADFNHDNVINSQDFFDFLTAFFAGC